MVSKGSSRGAGPQKKRGAVHVRASSGIDWDKHPPLCKCGQKMIGCFGCGDMYCASPGHVPHRCAEVDDG